MVLDIQTEIWGFVKGALLPALGAGHIVALGGAHLPLFCDPLGTLDLMLYVSLSLPVSNVLHLDILVHSWGAVE